MSPVIEFEMKVCCIELQHNQGHSISCSRFLAQSLSVDPGKSQTPVPTACHLGWLRIWSWAQDSTGTYGNNGTRSSKYGPSWQANWVKMYTNLQQKT